MGRSGRPPHQLSHSATSFIGAFPSYPQLFCGGQGGKAPALSPRPLHPALFGPFHAVHGLPPRPRPGISPQIMGDNNSRREVPLAIVRSGLPSLEQGPHLQDFQLVGFRGDLLKCQRNQSKQRGQGVTFKVKQIQVPLFGIVEARKAETKEKWYRLFAGNTGMITVTVDDEALGFIEEELQLDGQSTLYPASRYVSGEFRAKSKGLTGSTLGDFGEVITYLLKRREHQDVLRVTTWVPDPEVSRSKGDKFPQPDFIVREKSGIQLALEVKTTETFDALKLTSAKPSESILLKPCSKVTSCRSAALPQLGFVRRKLVTQRHRLELLREGQVVPFPANQGVAVAVLAQDGRTNSLRNDLRYTSPAECSQKGRNCWSCVAPETNLLVVTMKNRPAQLSLAGSDNGQWFRAYRRWTKAVWWRQQDQARLATRELEEAVISWISPDRSGDRSILPHFWGSYIKDICHRAGISVESNLPTLGDVDGLVDWTPVALTQTPRVLSGREMTALLAGDKPPGVYTLESPERGSFSLDIRQDELVFRYFPEPWARHEFPADEPRPDIFALHIAEIFLRLIFSLGEEQLGPFPRLSSKRVTAKVGESELFFGWTVAPRGHHFPWLRPAMKLWPFLLQVGDPRVCLRVHSDGRADLRVRREAWQLRADFW